ncbi:scavenger receptor cysteine-rich domain-containing protein DMBT1-like [Morphnus guianensis]
MLLSFAQGHRLPVHDPQGGRDVCAVPRVSTVSVSVLRFSKAFPGAACPWVTPLVASPSCGSCPTCLSRDVLKRPYPSKSKDSVLLRKAQGLGNKCCGNLLLKLTAEGWGRAGPADSASLRLVGGGSRCDGRVEILQRGTWGRVLDDQWDVQEASVVCRQLGCGEAEKAYNPPKPHRGSGPVGLRGVRCAGHEANLTLCNKSLPESAPVAGTVEDVGVVCWGSRRVRLVNGSGRCAGRVEVYYQGSWGTICDDGWDLSDATVICHQLGCGGAVQAVGSAWFGKGSGQIWLDGVNCSGAEDSLWDCPAGSWGQHDCGHKEDAGVVCSGLCREPWWEPIARGD